MLGRGLLGVAIAFAAYAGVAAPLSMRRSDGSWVVARPELLVSARRALIAVAAAVGGASVLLWYAFFARDFSIRYVAMNTTRSAQPWYTFSAFWSGMAGSLLLWCLILSIFAAALVLRGRPKLQPFLPFAIPVLAGTELFFLAITTLLENPFARVDVIPLEGRGMNPLLHSPGMIVHPPLLYTGLIGLSVPFAVAVSALVTKRTDEWIAAVRRWAILPWLALGAGLVIGGAWAYTELGWGGYWGWDPVENAALMPWLVATAFLHSAMVQERRGMLKIWNVFLVTAAAVLATFGTFLTRSGLLSSVHTFAESPVGRWFFVFLGLQSVLGLGLLIWRIPHLRARNQLDSAVSKESAFLANNLVFCGSVLVVLWGTLLPLATEAAFGSQLAVGPPFFNRVMAPVGAVLLLLASFGTVVPWRVGAWTGILRRLAWPAVAATLLAVVAILLRATPAFAGLLWVCTLLATTSIVEIRRNPRKRGGFVVHLGVAIAVIGMAGSLGRTQTEVVAAEGERFDFAGYTFSLVRLEQFQAPDKDVNLAVVDLYRGRSRITTLRPQMNLHRNWDQPQSEIAIRTTPAADVYLILAGVGPDGGVFRVHHNPLVLWVWIGALIAVVGGFVALGSGRRRRAPPRPRAPERELEPTRAD